MVLFPPFVSGKQIHLYYTKNSSSESTAWYAADNQHSQPRMYAFQQKINTGYWLTSALFANADFDR